MAQSVFDLTYCWLDGKLWGSPGAHRRFSPLPINAILAILTVILITDQLLCSVVSDVQIRSRDMRWMTMLHGIVSFVFNLLILSICINLIAGSLEASSTPQIASVSRWPCHCFL